MNNKKMNRNTKYSTLTTLSTLAFGLTLLVGLPQLSHAATYAYVNNFGSLSYVSANSATEAFANAVNIKLHSGVMLTNQNFVSTYTTPTYTTPNTTTQSQVSGYLYVNSFGQVVRVSANSATAAFLSSNNISPHSGVMSIDTVAESNMQGNTVRGI